MKKWLDRKYPFTQQIIHVDPNFLSSKFMSQNLENCKNKYSAKEQQVLSFKLVSAEECFLGLKSWGFYAERSLIGMHKNPSPHPKVQYGSQNSQSNVNLCALQDKMGEKCVQFQPCDHVYCKDCVKEYFETRIKDGMVQTMPCPYDKCDSEANQSQVSTFFLL